MFRTLSCAAVLAALLAPRPAWAQAPIPSPSPDTPSSVTGDPAAAGPPSAPAEPPLGKLTVSGYVEAYYAYNFGAPSNRITHARGFDNRHNTLSLANAVLDGAWQRGGMEGRVALQIGSTPSTYYLAEPSLPGAAATNATSSELWKYLQQAYGGYRFPVGSGLLVQAGLFLSPIGWESMAIKDNWSFSRSNLFFGLPFYHTGLRASYDLSERLAVTLAVYNGWNSVVDANDGKSLSALVVYKTPGGVTLSALYFGGPERAHGAPEGPALRHLLDAYAVVEATPTFAFALHGNAGFEPNRFGTSGWAAGAAYARARVLPALYVALRGDVFYERAARNALGSASTIFWPVAWVSSGTATLDVRPADGVSVRLEYRHDEAEGPLYFRGAVAGDGSAAAPWVPNARGQDTATLGLVTWL